MRIFNLLFTITLCALLGSLSSSAHAAADAIKISSAAQVEIEVIGKDGKKTLQRIFPVKAIPGTEVIYTNTFENVIDKVVSNIVINNAIPNDSEYKAGSAFGKDCEILFSADGGKKFAHAEELKTTDAAGKERSALAKEYTHIRWIYKGQLAAGKSGEIGFRAVIK